MIAKANTHDNGSRLARYITSGKEGEVAELWELRGFASRDVVDAFRSVHIMAQGGKCERPFLHVQVRNREGEVLTRSQWQTVADRIERILGFRGQPRAIAVHFDERTGHEHLHIAFSRIESETLKARPLPFSKIRLKKLCRELESQFGFAPVTNDRPGPIKFPPTRDQQAQAARLGVDVREVLETIRQCFDHADCGRSFKAALANNRLVLAKGDRRDFVVVDHAGGIHALGKRLLGLPVSQVRERLSDLATENLSTVKRARSELSTAQGSRKNRTVDGDVRARELAAPPPEIERSSSIISDRHAEVRYGVVPVKSAGSDTQLEWALEKRIGQPTRVPDCDRIRSKNSQQTNRFTPERGTSLEEPTAPRKQAKRTLGKALNVVGYELESVLVPVLTQEQQFENERETQRRLVDVGVRIDLSGTMARLAEEGLRGKPEVQPAQRPHIDERDR